MIDTVSLVIVVVTAAFVGGMYVGYLASRKRVKDAEMFAHAERTLFFLRLRNARIGGRRDA